MTCPTPGALEAKKNVLWSRLRTLEPAEVWSGPFRWIRHSRLFQLFLLFMTHKEKGIMTRRSSSRGAAKFLSFTILGRTRHVLIYLHHLPPPSRRNKWSEQQLSPYKAVALLLFFFFLHGWVSITAFFPHRIKSTFRRVIAAICGCFSLMDVKSERRLLFFFFCKMSADLPQFCLRYFAMMCNVSSHHIHNNENANKAFSRQVCDSSARPEKQTHDCQKQTNLKGSEFSIILRCFGCNSSSHDNAATDVLPGRKKNNNNMKEKSFTAIWELFH